jgi:hypothetical protein
MRKMGLLAICFCFITTLYGQTKKAVTSLTKLDLGLQGIGFSYEPKLFHNSTIDLCAGVGGGYDIYEGGQFTYYPLRPALYLSLTPKYFYNIQRRINKERNTLLNSANYFGVRIKYVKTFSPQTDLYKPISDEAVLTNIHWGIQRSIGGHWLFNTHAGVGFAIDGDCSCGTIYPALDFKFAYVIGKRKK